MTALSPLSADLLARHVPAHVLAAAKDRRTEPYPGRLTSAEQAAMFRARALARHESRVPDAYRDARLTADAPAGVRSWVQAHATGRLGRRRNSLLVTGPVGVGKTHLAYAALRAIAESGTARATWAGGNAAQVYARMRPESGETRRDVERELCAAPILLLDDLGASKDSDFTEDVTLALLDAREADGAPVLVTANLKPKDLRARIGDRAMSRLTGLCVHLEVTGPDRRQA